MFIYIYIADSPYIGRPGDRYIVSAFDEAQREVDKALNYTLFELFGDSHKRTPGELLQAFRFPTNEARESARAAEIYERALEIVWQHAENGAQFNISGNLQLKLHIPGSKILHLILLSALM